jgi:uncharacterized protein YbbC (DUF1343 family)
MISIYTLFNLLLLTFILFSCKTNPVVKTGLDLVLNYKELWHGKRVGIIANHSSYNSENEHISDLFLKMNDVEVVAFFSPEHGFTGNMSAGAIIGDSVHKESNIPIYSLYGKTKKPTENMLKNIDLLIFDIQDIGTRYYTYLSTMSLAMEAAAEKKIPFVVLDRPNPIGGDILEGNVLETEFASFIGRHPIPVRHGMTMAELAMMINGEVWLKKELQVDLHIIPMENWQRKMWYNQTNLNWRSPSPNIPNLDVATVYPGSCLFEGTNISEGRGTYQPFLWIGAPWFYEDQFSVINKIIDLPGVRFGPITFTPRAIPNMASAPKHVNMKLYGISISVQNRNKFRPFLMGIALIKFFYFADKKKFKWNVKHFDHLCGTNKIREFIIQGRDIEEIKSWMDLSIIPFYHIRNKYLLY